MRAVTVYLGNGTKYSTNINGTDQEIKKYFRVGMLLNIGTGEDGKPEDDMQSITDVIVHFDEFSVREILEKGKELVGESFDPKQDVVAEMDRAGRLDGHNRTEIENLYYDLHVANAFCNKEEIPIEWLMPKN